MCSTAAAWRDAMRIRKATTADEGALSEIDRLTWSEVSSPGPRPDTPFFYESGPEGVLVAEVDGFVAGYVVARHPTRFESSRHVLHIQGLAVHPEFQRRGIARALLDAVAELGVRRLTLRVFATNSAARALYESAGFEVEGVLRGEFLAGGHYVDDVLMARDLTRGPRPRTP